MRILRAFFPAAGLLVALAAVTVPSPAAVGEQEKTDSRSHVGIFGVRWENDLFAGTDCGYTHGIRFYWISPEIGREERGISLPAGLERPARRLPFPASPAPRRFLSVSLGQSIFTPDDITRSTLIPEDRPYAGFTYAGLGFHAASSNVLDGFEAIIGVVGPCSLGGDMQKFFHRTFGWTRPEGWDNQLRNELVLGLSADRRWKVKDPNPGRNFSWDAVARTGGQLSNAVTGFGGGFEIRAGRNLPKDFGSSFIPPGVANGVHIENGNEQRRPGGALRDLHIFAVIETRAVIRDIFLDGNTFRDSHRVEKHPFVADITVGLAFRNRMARVSFAYVLRSRRFVGQAYREIYGALNLTLKH